MGLNAFREGQSLFDSPEFVPSTTEVAAATAELDPVTWQRGPGGAESGSASSEFAPGTME
jgi:hypothetical protein